jgi:tetratricopeptide (TPR) repeat protein
MAASLVAWVVLNGYAPGQLSGYTPGQPAREQPVVTSSADWTHLVDLYLAGDARAAVGPILHTAPDQVARAATAAYTSWGQDTGAASGRSTRRLQASAMLSLDLLLALGTDAPSSALQPYQALGERAIALLERETGGTRPSPADDRLIRQFRTWWQVGLLQYLVASGKHLAFVERDRRVDMAAGQELAAADREFLRGLVAEARARAATPSGWMLWRGSSAVDEPATRTARLTLGLEAAASSFRRALALDPTHGEAQVHLGRTLLELGRLDEATTMLTPLATRPCGHPTCGLAWLSVGDVHDLRDQPDEAAEAYARASSAAATRQAALFALMQLALRRGDAAQAFALTAQFERGPLASQAGTDAWTDYTNGRRPQLDAVQQRLRQAVLP